MVDNKAKDFLDFYQDVIRCARCPLATSRNNVVPGEGPIHAKLMLIGEAPGFNEDQTGRPFVGPAGNFLNGLLESSRIDRKEMFITNTVLCRPPQNRTPSREEIKECRVHLRRILSIIQPRWVILAGAVALSSLFPKLSFGSCVEQPFMSNNILFLPIYHPAAALRFPKLTISIQRSLNTLRRVMVNENEMRRLNPRYELMYDENQPKLF